MQMKKYYPDLAVAAILLAVGTVLLGILLAKPLAVFLGQIMVDDAFYYLVPAQNFVQGLGTSLDGMNLSNGYHPLWMLLAIVGVMLTPAAMEVYLLSALSGLFYLAGAIVLSLYLLPRASLITKVLLFAVFCFNFFIFKIFMSGLENGLNFFLLAVILVFLQRPGSLDSARQFLLLGLLLSLLALSRVDHVLFAFFVLGMLGIMQRKNPEQLLNNSLRLGLPVLVIFGGYLCFNKLVFDSFLPISGNVKAFYESKWLVNGWPNGGFSANIWWHFRYVLGLAIESNINVLDGVLWRQFGLVLPNYVQLHVLQAILLGITAVGFGYSCYQVWRKELTPFYLALVAFACCHLVLYAIRLPHFTLYGTWYFAAEFLVSTPVVLLWLARHLSRPPGYCGRALFAAIAAANPLPTLPPGS